MRKYLLINSANTEVIDFLTEFIFKSGEIIPIDKIKKEMINRFNVFPLMTEQEAMEMMSHYSEVCKFMYYSVCVKKSGEVDFSNVTTF